MTKNRRLGRGLEALLGTPLDEAHPGGPATGSTVTADHPAAGAESAPPAPAPRAPSSHAPSPGGKPEGEKVEGGENAAGGGDSEGRGAGPLELNVYEIDNNPFQPRRQFHPEEIASLAESLKAHQQLQPVLVRRVGDRYQLISGERRLRAAIHAGLPTVRAEVREADDRLVAELALIENLQRKDLNAVEKALSFRHYIDQHGCTQDDLARRLKIDRSTIANLMRLLELPQELLEAIQQDRITAGHARALLPLGDEAQQLAAARQIQDERWSVRQTEHWVQETIRKEDEEEAGVAGAATKKRRPPTTPQIASLEKELRLLLGTKVEIRQTARGRGRITIHFTNGDEFERLRDHLQTGATATVRVAA